MEARKTPAGSHISIRTCFCLSMKRKKNGSLQEAFSKIKTYLWTCKQWKNPRRPWYHIMDGIVLDIRDPAVIGRVNSRGKMSSNGSRYFYSRHLPANDQDLAPTRPTFAQQAFEVPIVAAVDYGNVATDNVVSKVGRYDGLSKEARRND